MIPIIDIIFQNDHYYLLCYNEDRLNDVVNRVVEIFTLNHSFIQEASFLFSKEISVPDEYKVLETRDSLKQAEKIQRTGSSELFIRVKKEHTKVKFQEKIPGYEEGIYKTVNGRNFTFEEWKEYEQKSYEEYLKNKRHFF